MDYRALFKGSYLSAIEFNGREPTFTIVSVKLVKLESIDKPGTERDRGVIAFKEIDRGFVLNRSNAEALAKMWGTETDKWVGKRVTLFATPVRVGPKTELGIRVKGSPDLTAPITFDLKLPRKKPQTWKLVPTGPKAAPVDSTELDAQPPPPEDLP
jgi:hypothetical protein